MTIHQIVGDVELLQYINKIVDSPQPLTFLSQKPAPGALSIYYPGLLFGMVDFGLRSKDKPGEGEIVAVGDWF
jgi:hypothetical protein